MAAEQFLIGSDVVDVSQFYRKHPGGSIIKFMFGTDATDTFTAFHTRSKRAHQILKGLPKREATQTDLTNFRVENSREVLEDFEKLRQELKAEGYYDSNPLHFLYRILELALMHAAGFYLILNNYTHNRVLTAVGVFVLGIACGRCGWLMHEGGHGSMTGNLTIDWNLQRFFYGLGCGMSGRWWRINHNKHHATPQKLQHDSDLNTLPLVAFAIEVGTQVSNVFEGFFVGFQHYLFAPITCLLVSLGWQLFLHPRLIMWKGEWIEAFWISCRYLILAWLSHSYFGWYWGIVGYLAYMWVASTYIFVNFAVSHTHLPTVASTDHVNWVQYSAFFTMNCSHTWWCNWWMAYLNFQIEHHLFPSMPQYRFPQIAPRVRALFEKYNYPYQYTTYWNAMHKTFSNLKNVAHAIG